MPLNGRLRLSCDAVVFDCDGVLVYSQPAVEDAWRRLCLEFGLDAAAVMPTIHGVRSIDTLAAWLPRPTARVAERRLEDLEVERAGEVEAVSGAPTLTALLPFDRWGVATSGARRLAIARLEAVGIVPPAVLVGAGDVPRGKPHPDPYLRAAGGLGVDPARIVVFEDTPAGATAAREAGAAVVAVATTYPVGTFPADGAVNDLSEVRCAVIGRSLELTIASA